MSALTVKQAAEQLAQVVESAKPDVLVEVYAELFPEKPSPAAPSASSLAQHIRTGGLEAEEIVDLWNVIFPSHHNVWFNEVDNKFHYSGAGTGN